MVGSPKNFCGDSEHFRKAGDAVSLFLFPVECLYFSICLLYFLIEPLSEAAFLI